MRGPPECGGDGGDLAVQHLGVGTSPEANNRYWVELEQRGGEGSGDGGVPHAHLAHGDQDTRGGFSTQPLPGGDKVVHVLSAQSVCRNEIPSRLTRPGRQRTRNGPVTDAGVEHDDSEPCRSGGHHPERLSGHPGRQDVTGDVLFVGRDPVGAHRVVGTDQDQATAGGDIPVTEGQHPIDGTVEAPSEPGGVNSVSAASRTPTTACWSGARRCDGGGTGASPVDSSGHRSGRQTASASTAVRRQRPMTVRVGLAPRRA